jgi:hypothetical protein
MFDRQVTNVKVTLVDGCADNFIATYQMNPENEFGTRSAAACKGGFESETTTTYVSNALLACHVRGLRKN